MKVLYFSSDNTVSSGAFRSLVQLVAEEQMKGIECIVVLPGRGDGETLLKQKNIRYKVIRSYPWIVPVNKLRVLEYLYTLYCMGYNLFAAEKETARLIDGFKPDVVHMNTSWNYVGAKEAIKRKIPVVWHIREFLEEDQRRRILFRKYGYRLISKATKIVCISHSIFKKYKMILPREKMVYISNGIDAEEFLDTSHKPLQKDRINVICVGHICRSKGQIDVIKALCKLNNPNISLKLVGGYKKYYKWYIEHFVQRQGVCVEFSGRKSDVKAYYQNADIFVMSSRAEAWGRVTVEAMMSGCLVIGSNSMGTAEIIQDKKTGYLYQQGDAAALAEVILYVLRNREEAQRAASQGRSFAEEKLTSKRNAMNIYGIYKQIIKGKQDRSGL